jgi:hypothetical protein
VAGVLGNGGSAHALTDNFAVFGYHVDGSTGRLFLHGIVVGAAAMLGLSVLRAGAVRSFRRRRASRRELKRSQGETKTLRRDRDELVHQLDDERASGDVGTQQATKPGADRGPGPAGAAQGR